MKIALPSRNNQVDSHFGHCRYYTIFTVDTNRKIVAEEKLEAPVGCGCKSDIASVLAQKGVKVMLAGNMGNGAVNILNANGIDVVRGCTGDVKAVAEAWLDNRITDSGTGCTDHGDCHH
jgi:predicted Fe-Mo cluster-binding NifX family protein